MQTIEPNQGILFCKEMEAAERTQAGLFITSETKISFPKIAVVLNVFPKSKYKTDDLVVYKSYATNSVELNGEQFMLVAEEDVLGRVLEVEDENKALKELEHYKSRVTKQL